MHAALSLEIAVGIAAFDAHGDALDARLFAQRQVQNLQLILAYLGPVGVHALQYLSPVLGVNAAGPGVNGKNGVVGVVLAAQHKQELTLVELIADLAGFSAKLST